MSVLRPRVLLMAVGLLLQMGLLAGTLLVPGIRHGGFLLPFAVALASGLLVGRWWAPVPFVILGVAWLAFGSIVASVEGIIYFTLALSAWTIVCLIGVVVRMLFTGELAHLGDPAPPSE